MRTEQARTSLWCFVCAGALIGQLFAIGALPYELAEPWDKVFHGLAYASLTLLLWIGTDGRWPLPVTGGLMALGFVDELCQSAVPTRGADVTDFLANALAVGATGFALFVLREKLCAESSRR